MDTLPERKFPLPAFALLKGDAAIARLRAARTTPFQRAEWLAAWLAAHPEDEFHVVDLADEAGNALLLPLIVKRRFGLRLARKPGGAHASYYAPAFLGNPALSSAALRQALTEAGKQLGIDGFFLQDCSAAALGPLAGLPARPSPENAALLTMGESDETILDRLLDKEDRKKLRYRRRKLGESGEVQTGWAEGPEAIREALAAFLGWKEVQFAAMGISDAFASTDIRDFLYRASLSEPAAIRLFVLQVGERPAAVIGVARSGDHAAGMFTAYDPRPEIARFSPGDVLVSDLLDALAREGFRSFDLGIGAARYKDHFCPEVLPLVDIAVPASPAGRIAAPLWFALRRLKGIIKRHPGIYQLLRRLKRAEG